MKIKGSALSFILSLLVSVMAVAPLVEVAKANPLPPDWMNPKMTITIQSPQNGTGNALPVLVNFTALCTREFVLGHSDPNNPSQDWIRDFYYVIDNQNMSSQGINFTQIQALNVNDPIYSLYYNGQASLTNLTDGSHTITVNWGALVNVGTPAQFIVYNASWSATSQFYVTTQEPTLSSPEFLIPIFILVLVIAVTLIALMFRKKHNNSKINKHSETEQPSI